ncbi:Putative CENP-V/GFA domain, Mss4-like superfamily protein [Septoria linicola]|uniref:CENP-V/GFA domain, Mss4-like superfamily protein n=1 Tax=Septoria linicola TaxID=215465 RepID=A0A9Q9AZE2_9PEZI|nr:putative CENP-V/GFA domain, Mss4-like superfamily protein [Septoria linicola]USW54823.1 Putative CENP-V/GFA domain, Mss4-like superfamily protein [Septoria linicola]
MCSWPLQLQTVQYKYRSVATPISSGEPDLISSGYQEHHTAHTLTTSSHIPKAQEGPIPLATEGAHGENAEHTATATCFYGIVQIEFATEGPDYRGSFICNSSMFSTILVVADAGAVHTRGEEKLSRYSQHQTLASGNEMANYFCSVCGTLMYCRSSGYQGFKLMRLGTVDDFSLHESKLKPEAEQLTRDRVSWLLGAEGVQQVEGSFSTAKQ